MIRALVIEGHRAGTWVGLTVESEWDLAIGELRGGKLREEGWRASVWTFPRTVTVERMGPRMYVVSLVDSYMDDDEVETIQVYVPMSGPGAEQDDGWEPEKPLNTRKEAENERRRWSE